MLKIFIPVFFISSFLHAQSCLFNAAKDSDAVFLSNKEIALNKISKIVFIEQVDTLCFKNYPLPSPPISFLLHTCNFNLNGLCVHYEWSFTDKDFVQKNEADAPSGRFFILNEYDFDYENYDLKEIKISDVGRVSRINYSYSKDSIIQVLTYYLPNGSLEEKKHSYSASSINNEKSEIIISHTGIKQNYFPKYQIVDLGLITSGSLFINDIPVTSFISGKFEQKRFLMEIRPGLWIFFEIGE